MRDGCAGREGFYSTLTVGRTAMDFALSTEQKLLQDSVARMVERDINPILEAHDQDRSLPKEPSLDVIRHYASQGLTCARLPESAGGSGMRMLDLGLIYELIPPATVFGLLSQDVTVARIYAESDPALRERFLPDLIAGKRIACTATTEPDVGSDPRSVKTRAEQVGDHWVVNGRKLWISNASVADVVNTTVAVGKDENGLSKMMRLLIDKEESPFEARDVDTLGVRQGHLGEILFDDCKVPAANAMGHAGDAARILQVTWIASRPLLGMCIAGMAKRALDAAIEYAGQREQFGKAIGGHQLIQSRLADIATAVTTSRLICLQALAAIDAGERANGISALAKRHAVSACEQAINSAMHIHGAMGISRELGLEQALRDARMFPIPDGTNEVLTLIAGRELTGIAAYRA